MKFGLQAVGELLVGFTDMTGVNAETVLDHEGLFDEDGPLVMTREVLKQIYATLSGPPNPAAGIDMAAWSSQWTLRGVQEEEMSETEQTPDYREMIVDALDNGAKTHPKKRALDQVVKYIETTHPKIGDTNKKWRAEVAAIMFESDCSCEHGNPSMCMRCLFDTCY